LSSFSSADLKEVEQMAGASDRWTARRSRKSASDANLGSASAVLSPSARLPLLAALGFLLSIAASCSAEPAKHTPPIGQGGGGGEASTGSVTPAACSDEGATEECHVTLGQHEGVLSCFVGTRTCANGRFGECTDGSVSNFAMPPGGSELRNLSDATACTGNPCDPTCQLFDEKPIGGAVISLTPWSNGRLVDLQNDPGGAFKKGIKEPCSTASDCQFNEYCQDPTSGTCEHSQCETGGALKPGCDPCVTEICAVDPTCCSGAWSQSCVDQVHDVCGAFCSGSTPQGLCKPWLPGEADTRCDGLELTLGIPCTSQTTSSDLIAVCNVGAQVAPKGLDVFAYDSGAGFTDPSSDICKPKATLKVDCGSTTDPIPPGGCINVTCAGLSGGEEIQVNPPTANQVSECQCRNNWTIFNAGLACELVSCPGTPALCKGASTTQTYTNNCPPGTRVQWGFLGWNTTTPAGTNVTFEARTADTAAELATATYRMLGTAQSTPTDTQLCPIGSACRVDLFNKLNGAPEAMRDFLELSVTLQQNVAAGLTPAVLDWQLTYSCPPAE
jgi:hypothetical protein